MPCRLVVTKGWNSWALISGAMPLPVSETAIATISSGATAVDTIRIAPFAILHGLNSVAHQIEQHLLHLYLIRQRKVDAGDRNRSCTRTPVSLAPTSASALASSSEFSYVLHPPLALPARDEVAQAADPDPARNA